MTRIPSVLRTASLAVPLMGTLCLALGGLTPVRAAAEPPTWRPGKKAAEYLDSRVMW